MAEIQPEAGRWASRPVYTRVAIVGLLVFGLVLPIFGTIGAITGDSEAILFALVLGVPSLVFAWLVWRFGRWPLIVAAVWALLNLLGNGPFIIPSMVQFNSFFDFGIVLPLIVGLLVAIVDSIVAFVQHRRGTARTQANTGERRVFVGITVVVVGLMALSGVLHLTSLESVSATDKAAATPIKMKNTEFEPVQIQTSAGRPAKLVVVDNDLGRHTFTMETLGIDYTISAGSEQLIELPSLTAGTYPYLCTIPGHEDMKGTLVVQ